MPTISMFYSIVIYLYFFDDVRHNAPHIHAKYQGSDAAFSILDGELLTGSIPLAKTGWCKPGSKYIAKPCWRTGIWP